MADYAHEFLYFLVGGGQVILVKYNFWSSHIR